MTKTRYFPQADTTDLPQIDSKARDGPTYEVWRQLSGLDVDELSALYLDHVRREGNEEYDHGGRPWRASISYIDEGKVKNEVLGACFKPMIDTAMAKLEEALGLKLRCESAFANLYDADAGQYIPHKPHPIHPMGRLRAPHCSSLVICHSLSTPLLPL
jgi:hypothetical protein